MATYSLFFLADQTSQAMIFWTSRRVQLDQTRQDIFQIWHVGLSVGWFIKCVSWCGKDCLHQWDDNEIMASNVMIMDNIPMFFHKITGSQ